MSDYEAELHVHDALVNGCTYDSASDHTGSAYGAWVLGARGARATRTP